MGQPPNARWKAVLTTLRDDMHRHALSLEDFRPYRLLLFPIIASVLYTRDCETSHPSAPTSSATFPHFSTHLEVLEHTPSIDLLSRAWKHMLCVDYGVPGVSPVNAIGNSRAVDVALFAFAESVTSVATHFCHYWSIMTRRQRVRLWHFVAVATHQMDPSDFGMMLYHLHAHHERPYRNAQLGHDRNYTGALWPLADSIPSKGPEGLIRKLSVDYHVMVPALRLHHPREACSMNEAIRTLAATYGICLTVPTDKTVERMDRGSEGEEKESHRSRIQTSIRLAFSGRVTSNE
ncbi:hypothetical protein PG993_010516 [Apiospora rasikravindrae]|uniref:Uncharacterized protein n=1 Tax=Apiospora rasikravindrae TaxID=990691 RepID=A0ABR1SMF7_9PEZI